MANFIHIYFYIENLGLNDSQRDTMRDWVSKFGAEDNSPNPARRMQVRHRLDGQAAIFEAVVNEDWLKVNFVKDKMADLFAVSPATINHVILDSAYGDCLDFERPAGTKRLRLGVFGGLGATWAQSGAAARQYLEDNRKGWERDL